MSIAPVGVGPSLPKDPLFIEESRWIITEFRVNERDLSEVLNQAKLTDPNAKALNANTIATTFGEGLRRHLNDKNIRYSTVENHSLKFNLVNLRERGVGTRFFRDENTGLLQRLDGFFEKIWYSLNPYYRAKIDLGVQRAVEELLAHLGTLNYNEDTVEGKLINHGHRIALQGFFINSEFKRLNQKIYDRSKIPKNIIRILQGADFRKEKAERKNKKVKEHSKVDDKVIGFKNEYNYRKEKVKFAQSLGVEIVRNKAGSSGNYTGRSWQSRPGKPKPLLIIKPYDEGPDSQLNPNFVGRIKNFIWKYIPFVSRRTCYFHNHNPVQEAASGYMDKRFGLGVIPYTQYEKSFVSRAFHGGNVNEEISKNASCTIFVKDVEEAYDVLDLIKPRWWLPFQIPLVVQRFFLTPSRVEEMKTKLKKDVQFDNVVIAHIAAGNGDGHPANYLIRKVSKQLIAIDFGWSFPHSHPSDYLALRFMYDFRHLPHADESFEPETFEKIGEIRGNIKIHLKKIREHLQDMTNANHDPSAIRSWPMEARPDPASLQIKTMWQRLQPLFKAYDQNEKLSELLGEDFDNKEFKAAIIKHPSSRTADEQEMVQNFERGKSAEQIKVVKDLIVNLKICNIASVRSQEEFTEFFRLNKDNYPENPPDLDS